MKRGVPLACKLLILFCIFLTSCVEAPLRRIYVKALWLKAEIADTDTKRLRGLMFRNSLAYNQAMLFIFDKEGIYSFWMKNMKIPLDIIWINKDKKIVDIKTNVSPCQDACASLIPYSKAMYVLEVNSGFVQKHRLGIGQRVDF